MITPARNGSPDRVLIDLNTQCDFLLPAGALPVANRGELLPRIRDLMNWVRLQQLPVISSLEANRPGEVHRGFPPHCIDSSRGQRKLPFTLLPRRLYLAADNTFDVPLDPFRRYQQIIFSKRNQDFLTNPKADRLINSLTPYYWIVFGVTVSHCVKSVVLGLLARQQRVVVIQDACGYWSAADAEIAFRMMDAKGAVLISAEELYPQDADQRLRDRCNARMLELHREIEEEETIGAAGPNGGNGRGWPHNERNEHGRGHDNGRSQSTDRAEKKNIEAFSDLAPTHIFKRKPRSARPSARPPRGLA